MIGIMKKHGKLIIFLGWIGTILLIGAYILNLYGFLSSAGMTYALINIISGTLLTIRVYYDKDWSLLALNFFWAIIPIGNVIKILLHK